jgi:hypothetical protein
MEDEMRHRMAIVSSIAAAMLLSASSLALAQPAPPPSYGIQDVFASPGGAALTGELGTVNGVAGNVIGGVAGSAVNGVAGNVVGGVAGSAVRGVAGNVGHGPAGSAGDHNRR